jgi:pyruvate-formate lyase-activating enzyme
MFVSMVYCDDQGRMYDHPDLALAGLDGLDPAVVPRAHLVPVPEGSDFMMLPGRKPVGIDPGSGRPVTLDEVAGRPVVAAAVFMAPAYVQTWRAAYVSGADAPALPLYAYTALGYARGKFYAAGFRVDEDPRQDPWRFDPAEVQRRVAEISGEQGGNRVIEQLVRCAMVYGCRAAQNFFLGRWEAPLPTSVACNSACVGCLSQQKDGTFKASHDRLQTPPSADEVAGAALFHIDRVERPVVSFGQGCEGEPLLMRELLVDSIRKIRGRTDRGTINLNTNGSLPEVVAELIEAGLDSIRVSLNSLREDIYNCYYRPKGYNFGDVLRTIEVARKDGIFVSLNLLVFPGVTDTTAELDAFEYLTGTGGVDMVQLRNLNIDPDVYLRALPEGACGHGLGVGNFRRRLKKMFPKLQFGYFNPPKETFPGKNSP